MMGFMSMWRRQGDSLTHGGQVPEVLLHHVSVQASLSRVQKCPFFRAEHHGHICKSDCFLKHTIVLDQPWDAPPKPKRTVELPGHGRETLFRGFSDPQSRH
jgi:hypothetical protein